MSDGSTDQHIVGYTGRVGDCSGEGLRFTATGLCICQVGLEFGRGHGLGPVGAHSDCGKCVTTA